MRPFPVIWCAALLAVTPLLQSAPGDAPSTPLQLFPNDRIVVLGNASADAFFQDGYFETLLHVRFPNHRLHVRNLAFPGDTAKGRGPAAAREQWLREAAPDVLLIFFGGAESFAGERGLAAFRSDLAALLKKAANLDRGNRGPLRLAVFGPMAADVEQGAPETRHLNASRKLYSEAAAAVAGEAGVPFVDLFDMTQELFATGPQRSALIPSVWGAPANALQTATGLLSAEAHRLLAPKIFRALLAQPAPNLPPESGDGQTRSGGLRAAVVARHAEWQARYRPAAGAPLPRDWNQFQPALDRHDAAVWSLANGEEPAAEEKPTNKPAPASTRTPEPELKVQAGFRIQKVADSTRFPELTNPVQIGWDSFGRLGVLCRPHPGQGPLPASADRLLLFEDTDSDGLPDRSSVFADHLNHAGAFTFHRDGVFLEQAGDLWLLRDPNKTGKATSRERILPGLGVAGATPGPGRLLSDPRGAVYWGDAGPHRSRVETGTHLLSDARGMVVRIEPVSGTVETLLNSGLEQAPGILLASWGNVLFTDAKAQFWHFGSMVYGRAEPLSKQAGWPLFWEKAPSPCTGSAIIRGGHFPSELQGALFATTTTPPAGIRQAFPREGSQTELLSSDAPSFLPRALATGPDGSLFFADGGPQDCRIYRITAEDRPLPDLPSLTDASVDQLLEALKSPEESVREQARHRLGSLPATRTLEALRTWVNRLLPADPQFERHRLEALWTSRWLGALELPLLEQVLASREPQARAQAVRIVCEARAMLPNAMRRLELMATDAHERVRLEVLAAAGSFANADTASAVRLVHRVLLSPLDATLERVANEMLRQLEPDPAKMLLPSDPAVLRFVLGRLSDAELSKAPAAESVWLAQLGRVGISTAAKETALHSLAKKRDTDFVTEMALVLIQFDANDSGDTLTAPLLELLALRPPAELRPGRAALQRLAASAKPGRLRRSAHAAWLQSASPGEVWDVLGKAPDRQAELLQSLVHVVDRSVRAACHPLLLEVLRRKTDVDSPVYRAALAALPLTGAQFSAENLELLCAPLLEGHVLPEAVQALAQLPEAALRGANLEKLLDSLNAWMKTQSGAARETAAFAQALQLARTLAGAWEEQVRATVETLRKQSTSVLVVRTVCDEARFDATQLSVGAGQPLQILFENHDVRPQNFVLAAPGEAENVLRMARQMPTARDTTEKRQAPGTPGVVATSRLLAPGERQLLKLRAPSKAGDYEYLSTVPGQTNAPRGILRVLP